MHALHFCELVWNRLAAEMCVRMCKISNNFDNPTPIQEGKNVCDVHAGMTENYFRPTMLNGLSILKIKIL